MRDLRYALRQLAKHPGFTAVAVLTLGLGIGANTAIFSVAAATVFRSLPFADPARLVRIYEVPESGRPWISPRTGVFRLVRDDGRFFASIVAQRYREFTLETEDGPERISGDAVSAGWTTTLGVSPMLGRSFTPEEQAQGEAAGVVLLSYGAWQRRFGADPAVVGRSIRFDGSARRVIGVMPAGFRYPYGAELWVPLRVDAPQPGPWSLNIQARLAPGVTLAQARAELRGLTPRAVAQLPGFSRARTLTAIPTRQVLLGDIGGTVLALEVAVGFLLLIVCVNLANLLLARALGREREFVLRLSLGASRRRLARQLLTESVVLALAGAAVAVAVAYLVTPWMGSLIPRRLADFQRAVTVEPLALLFTMGLAAASAAGFGLAPALQLAARHPAEVLAGGIRTTGRPRTRRLSQMLIVGELGLALMLLSGAGLMLRELWARRAVAVGYPPDGVLTFSASLARAPYETAEARTAFVQRAVAALETTPGVASAGVTSLFPSHRANAVAEVEVEGRNAAPGEALLVNHRLVDPGFLPALGVPLLKGRWLSRRDRADAPPVALVSRALARRLWPGENAVGHRVRNARLGANGPWMTVVGVVGDVREFWDVIPTWYLPYAQHAATRDASAVTFAVRGAHGTPPALAAVRRALAGVDPTLPIAHAASATDLQAAALAQPREAAWLAGAAAGVGLLLAVLGLYGSIAYTVRRRTAEIGIRMAMGADRALVLETVVAQGARLVLVGTALGFAGSVILTRLLATATAHVAGFDLLTFVAAVVVLGTTAMIAVLVPAQRAARVDPVEALRYE